MCLSSPQNHILASHATRHRNSNTASGPSLSRLVQQCHTQSRTHTRTPRRDVLACLLARVCARLVSFSQRAASSSRPDQDVTVRRGYCKQARAPDEAAPFPSSHGTPEPKKGRSVLVSALFFFAATSPLRKKVQRPTEARQRFAPSLLLSRGRTLQ